MELLHFSTTDLSEDGVRDGLRQAAEVIEGTSKTRNPNREPKGRKARKNA
jgi:hypothetical protein